MSRARDIGHPGSVKMEEVACSVRNCSARRVFRPSRSRNVKAHKQVQHENCSVATTVNGAILRFGSPTWDARLCPHTTCAADWAGTEHQLPGLPI